MRSDRSLHDSAAGRFDRHGDMARKTFRQSCQQISPSVQSVAAVLDRATVNHLLFLAQNAYRMFGFCPIDSYEKAVWLAQNFVLSLALSVTPQLPCTGALPRELPTARASRPHRRGARPPQALFRRGPLALSPVWPVSIGFPQ
jgi:hypothetical protein